MQNGATILLPHCRDDKGSAGISPIDRPDQGHPEARLIQILNATQSCRTKRELPSVLTPPPTGLSPQLDEADAKHLPAKAMGNVRIAQQACRHVYSQQHTAH